MEFVYAFVFVSTELLFSTFFSLCLFYRVAMWKVMFVPVIMQPHVGMLFLMSLSK